MNPTTHDGPGGRDESEDGVAPASRDVELALDLETGDGPPAPDVDDDPDPAAAVVDVEDDVVDQDDDDDVEDLDDEGAEWEELQPLDPDDLAAPDPSDLETDLLETDLIDDDLDDVDVHEPAGPASTRTADDLTSGTVLRRYTRPPQSGWRRLIHQMTGGTVTPRQSRSDRERAEQLRAIRTLVGHPRRITVLSRKGGVGKTTTTLMLGQTLASERGDRMIAVDGNPDAGNLGYRVDPTHTEASITDVLNDLENINRYADMRQFTTQTPAGLEVLRSDDDPQISTALGDREYGAIMSLLDRFYNLVLIDTGTGILDSAVQGILDGTDQIVLVVSPSLDAARAASQTLDWLTEHGFVELVENAVTVINQTRRTALVDVARIEDHFWDRCGATVRIPWDGYLEAGAEADIDDLRPATRDAYRHLAAAVARRFDT